MIFDSFKIFPSRTIHKLNKQENKKKSNKIFLKIASKLSLLKFDDIIFNIFYFNKFFEYTMKVICLDSYIRLEKTFEKQERINNTYDTFILVSKNFDPNKNPLNKKKFFRAYFEYYILKFLKYFEIFQIKHQNLSLMYNQCSIIKELINLIFQNELFVDCFIKYSNPSEEEIEENLFENPHFLLYMDLFFIYLSNLVYIANQTV